MASPPDDAAAVAAELKLAVGRLARRLRQSHAVGDITLSELSVLSRLDREGPAAPGMLADSERVRPQAMATTLAGLEQRGLVRRTPDPTDGRRVRMALTDAGRTVVLDRRSAGIQRLATALDREFTADERARLQAAVGLLDRLAEQL